MYACIMFKRKRFREKHVQAWHMKKKRLDHKSCLTTVLIVLILHYLNLEEIRYTTFSVVQSVFCLSLTVAPEDDFTVPAEVIILQH